MDSRRTDGANSYLPLLLRLAAAGTELIGWLVGPTLLGYWLDERFGTAPVLVLVGGGLGMVGGMTILVRRAITISKLVNQRKDGDRPQ